MNDQGEITTVSAMNDRDVVRLIFETIDEMNDFLPPGGQLQKSMETHLLGRQGKLDSLALVNFIVMLEQNIADEFGAAVALADEKAFSRDSSPFRTVQTLTDYVTGRLREADDV